MDGYRFQDRKRCRYLGNWILVSNQAMEFLGYPAMTQRWHEIHPVFSTINNGRSSQVFIKKFCWWCIGGVFEVEDEKIGSLLLVSLPNSYPADERGSVHNGRPECDMDRLHLGLLIAR